jgi:ribonuclease inhibitor
MKEIRLDGKKMLDRAATHAYLKRELDLPVFYGNNLDALWDCMSTDFSPKYIAIFNADILVENLGSYGESIIRLFRDAAKENDCLKVDVEVEKEGDGGRQDKGTICDTDMQP